MIRSTRIVQNGTSIEGVRKAALKAAFKVTPTSVRAVGLGSARRAPAPPPTLLRLVDDAIFGVDHGLIVCRGSRRRVTLRLQADPRHGPDLLALSCPVEAIYPRLAHTENSRPLLAVADQI